MVNQSGGLCSVTWSRCKPSFSHRVTKLSHASLRFQHWLAFASHARDFLLSQARVWLIDSSRFKRSISCSGPRCLSCDFRLSRLIATQGSSENVVYVQNEPSKCIALFVLALAARYLRYHKSQVLTRKNTLINVHIKFLLIKSHKCYRYKWLCNKWAQQMSETSLSSLIFENIDIFRIFKIFRFIISSLFRTRCFCCSICYSPRKVPSGCIYFYRPRPIYRRRVIFIFGGETGFIDTGIPAGCYLYSV